MNVYTAALMAWRAVDGEQILRIKPGIVLATSDDDAQQRMLAAAAVAFPAAEGFTDHQVVCVELPPRIELEGYWVEWQVTQ